MAVDWLKIKAEYVNGNISLRKLATKVEVSYSQLAKVAAAEKWNEARENQRIKIESKQNQKIAEKIAEKEANRITRLLSLSDQLSDRIEQAIQELDRAQVTHKTKTRVLEYKDLDAPGKPTKETIQEEEQILAVASIVDRKGLQQVAAALKAAWDIAGAAPEQPDGLEDDGLLEALGKNAGQLFDDGDDSDMLPAEEEGDEDT